MSKSPGHSRDKPASREVEFLPDAWGRFERAVNTVAKAPPQHRKGGVTPPGGSHKVENPENADDQCNGGDPSGNPSRR